MTITQHEQQIQMAAPAPLDEVERHLRDNLMFALRTFFFEVAGALDAQNIARALHLVERMCALQRNLLAHLAGAVPVGLAPKGSGMLMLSNGEQVPAGSVAGEEGIDGMPLSDDPDVDVAGQSIVLPPSGSGFVPAQPNAIQGLLGSLGINGSMQVSEPDGETFGAQALQSIVSAFTRTSRAIEPSADKLRKSQVDLAEALLRAARTLNDPELIEQQETRLHDLLANDGAGGEQSRGEGRRCEVDDAPKAAEEAA
jgi:hypothetical protein